MARYEVEGATPGFITVPDQPAPPSGGGGGDIDAGAGRASVSYPWLDTFVGYGTIYIDRYPAGHFRTLNAGFNGVLTIGPDTWPPGYRVPNGSKGGGYPASGTKPTGTEPIRLCPPPKGKGRLAFHTQAKVVITNPHASQKGTFAAGLGVIWPSENNRPMRPYLGAAHDLDINQFRQETIGPGDTRSVTMFRTDFIDIGMDGGAATFPQWPDWECNLSSNGNQMYPAVGISFKNAGSVPLQVGNIYAYGWVS